MKARLVNLHHHGVLPARLLERGEDVPYLGAAHLVQVDGIEALARVDHSW